MPNLITDDQGLAKPQYEAENGSAFESQRGKEGAMFVFLKETHAPSIGTKADPESTEGDGSVISLLKGLRNVLQSIRSVFRGGLPENLSASGALRVSNIDPVNVNLLRMNTETNLAVSTTQVEAVLTPVDSARKALRLYNLGTVPVYWGIASGVTTTTGAPIAAGSFAEINATNVYLIASEATNVKVVEMI